MTIYRIGGTGEQLPHEHKRKPLSEKEQLLLSFLRQTREGKYVPIDDSSLLYSKEETETIESLGEEFYYGVS